MLICLTAWKMIEEREADRDDSADKYLKFYFISFFLMLNDSDWTLKWALNLMKREENLFLEYIIQDKNKHTIFNFF